MQSLASRGRSPVSDKRLYSSQPVDAPPRVEVPANATGVIIVDLAQLRANWKALAARVAPAECGAVVKADAYGLGAARIVPALRAAGCKTFFVATPTEAAEVRSLTSDATIYVLNGLLPGTGPELLSLG